MQRGAREGGTEGGCGVMGMGKKGRLRASGDAVHGGHVHMGSSRVGGFVLV